MPSNASRPVPSFDGLSDIYTTEEALLRESVRWASLSDKFSAEYGQPPTHIVRAPGRVNVLGEHIDYSLFPVLPAAIEQDIIIAVLPVPSQGEVVSVDLCNVSELYPSVQLRVPRTQPGRLTDAKVISGWERYAQAVMVECLDRFGGSAAVDMKIMVSGTVPSGAGLSSSAAFVVAVIIAFLVANGLQEEVERTEIVDLAMAAEHRLGLNSGGMDQAASILSSPNSLLHLSFYPSLHASNLPLPSALSLVITNSMAPHALADSAPERYNLRVVEILCATRILLHALKVDVDVPGFKQGGSTGRLWLREALEHWAEAKHMEEHEMYEALLARIPGILGQDERGVTGWTKEQMIEGSGMSAEDFEATFLNFIPVRAQRFHLLKRVQHTLEESLRVCHFKAVCETLASHVTSPSQSETLIKELGDLVTASHHSMKDLYEATVPEVDELQALCLECGSLGSRQTGGGWGGAVISLIPAKESENFLLKVKSRYAGFKALSDDQLNDAAFVTIPGSGAGVYSLLHHPPVKQPAPAASAVTRTSALNSDSANGTFTPEEHVHRRFNPLLGKHILVSPHRSLRPWNGQTEPTVATGRPSYDPSCYLCPGNKRSTGQTNPAYEGVYVFDNDFPALLPDSLPSLPTEHSGVSPFFQSEPVRGRCKVICFHPRHDLSMASMDVKEIHQVLDSWRGVYEEEGKMILQQSEEGCVQIFENRGAMMGCSAPHPHGQVWTTSFVPDEPATELSNFALYKRAHPTSWHLLLDYALAEIKAGERVVATHESGWLAVVPFWATWPFEVLIIPSKRHIPSLVQLTEDEQSGLASIMKNVLACYDNLFSCHFPYSMGLHQSPVPPVDASTDPAQIHLHFYPPLLRSATIRKFMVGFELLGESQRDIPPEQAASRLRASLGKK